MKNNKPLIFGLIGSSVLLLIYFSIVTLINSSLSIAFSQFLEVWYWIILLASGFGFQLGLYTFIKTKIKEKTAAATAEIAASGTISTGSMLACCAHALVSVLPVLGISAASLFLVKYQLPLILFGVFSNLVGVTIMLNIIQKHKLDKENLILKKLFILDMKHLRTAVILIGIIVIGASAVIANKASATANENQIETVKYKLKKQKNNQSFVTVEAKPVDFNFGNEVKFNIKFTTHTVSLDFNLVEIAKLEDSNGNIYEPLRWEGDPPGGHHREGTIVFPEVSDNSKILKLTLFGVSGVDRVFKWDL